MAHQLLYVVTAFALVVAACTPAAQAPAATSAPPKPIAGAPAQPTTAPQAAPAATQPPAKPVAPPAADFKRPDVAPLAETGNFKVAAQTPWPGDKVRVFFLGVQF